MVKKKETHLDIHLKLLQPGEKATSAGIPASEAISRVYKGWRNGGVHASVSVNP